MESMVFAFLMSQKFHRRWSKKEQGVLPASLLQATVTQGLTGVSKGASLMRVSFVVGASDLALRKSSEGPGDVRNFELVKVFYVC